jgi:uroporphyrinogen decarboxylase
MTPRERWEAVLSRQKPDRIPMDYWATPEANEKLMKHLGCEDMAAVYQKLHIDKPVMVGAAYCGPALPEGEDVFGCRYKTVAYAGGIYSECCFNPLARYETVEEIEKNYNWPTTDLFDYSAVSEQVKGKDASPVQGGGSEPFLIYCYLRGIEQAYMDLSLNPEIVHYCLDKLFAFAYENTARIYEAIPRRVTFSYVAEDLGSETGLLFSLEQINLFLIPRMKRIMDLVHSAGAYVFTHSDGAVRPVIPYFIEAGTDVINPIQWNCPGMEREALKRDFGQKLLFHGGVDNQFTLPFGTAGQVRDEVAENIRIFGHDGGYILAPCHNIQSVSPAENIVALYEEGYSSGWM